METEMFPVGAPENPVDSIVEPPIQIVEQIAQKRIDDHESYPGLENARNLPYDRERGPAKVVKGEAHKSAVAKRQGVGDACDLKVARDRLLLLARHFQHGKRLIETDDPPLLEALRNRTGETSGARRKIEDGFLSRERQSLDEPECKLGANIRSRRFPVILEGVSVIVKAGFFRR